MSKKIMYLALALSLVLAACNGGGGDATAPEETTATTGGATSSTPEPTASTPTACTAAPINPAEPYSLVFKGCDASNVATYYDKTECVRQNSTGLIWQGQTAAGTGLRANNQYKTNYDSTTGNQNYNGGAPIPATSGQISDVSNSIGFRDAVNGTNLCGSNAWRLPTKEQLQSLVKATETPKIDNAWFPNTHPSIRYWSASPDASGDYAVWSVEFFAGTTFVSNRDWGLAVVRLVH